MRFIKRIFNEIRTRGVIGFFNFARTRVWQYREDVLFEMPLPSCPSTSLHTNLDKLVLVQSDNFGSKETEIVEREVLTDHNFAYREALQADDLLYAATDEFGHVSAYGFVLFDSFYKRILGESNQVPMIGNCFTFPQNRSRGLYTSLLVSISDHLNSQGYCRVIITCAPDNLASVRGIQKAGFLKVSTLRSLVIFSRWIAIQTRVDK